MSASVHTYMSLWNNEKVMLCSRSDVLESNKGIVLRFVKHKFRFFLFESLRTWYRISFPNSGLSSMPQNMHSRGGLKQENKAPNSRTIDWWGRGCAESLRSSTRGGLTDSASDDSDGARSVPGGYSGRGGTGDGGEHKPRR